MGCHCDEIAMLRRLRDQAITNSIIQRTRAERAEAERDALSATVDLLKRDRAQLQGWLDTTKRDVRVANAEIDRLRYALALQGEGKAGVPAACHDWCVLRGADHTATGCKWNTRGITGFDARGRRKDDPHPNPERYHEWDRRSNRTRRGGRGE